MVFSPALIAASDGVLDVDGGILGAVVLAAVDGAGVAALVVVAPDGVFVGAVVLLEWVMAYGIDNTTRTAMSHTHQRMYQGLAGLPDEA